MGENWFAVFLLLTCVCLLAIFCWNVLRRNRSRLQKRIYQPRTHISMTDGGSMTSPGDVQESHPSTPRSHTRPPLIKNENRYTLLLKHTQQARARHGFVNTLNACPDALVSLLCQRAISLYREEQGCSWSQASIAIEELLYPSARQNHWQPAPSGVDPMVTVLLLQANCREDAVRYFCWSSGADRAEALEAIDHIQRLVDSGNTLFLEHQKRVPEPAVIQFLLQAGYQLLAIRYYRDCTDVSLIEARAAIEEALMR